MARQVLPSVLPSQESPTIEGFVVGVALGAGAGSPDESEPEPTFATGSTAACEAVPALSPELQLERATAATAGAMNGIRTEPRRKDFIILLLDTRGGGAASTKRVAAGPPRRDYAASSTQLRSFMRSTTEQNLRKFRKIVIALTLA
jgi:hypothetical protein